MSTKSLTKKRKRALTILSLLKEHTRDMTPPASWSIVERFGRDPFLILISCLLSLRTKDTVSLPASMRVFEYAQTPVDLVQLDDEFLEELVFPCVYYKQKARTIKSVSQQLIDTFNNRVPSKREQLLTLKGVGKKTANLVLAEGFLIPALCVDVHVHRISNRLGLVDTKTPEETEQELQEILPKDAWLQWNGLLVMWGQNICVPRSPWCSRCVLREVCEQKDVVQSR